MKKIFMKNVFLANILMAFLLGCATMPDVKDASEAVEYAVITDIKLGENSLVISGDRQFVYTLYSANDPYKVTIDIPDANLGNFQHKIVPATGGVITEVIPLQLETPQPSVKLDIILQTPSSVIPSYKDNTLTLHIESDAHDLAALQNAGSSEPAESASGEEKPAPGSEVVEKISESGQGSKKSEAHMSPLAKAKEVNRIHVERTADVVKVVISGDGVMTPNVFPLDERIVVDIPDVAMNASLPADPVMPLKGIRAGKYRDKVRLVLDLKEKTNFDVSAVGGEIEISLKREEAVAEIVPKREEAQTSPAPKTAPVEITSVPEVPGSSVGKYSQKKISLDFQDAEIGPIFRLLADVNGYNLVLDPSVKGRITIKLMNVPWDQALDIILNTFNLSKSIEGNILWIAPTSVFAKMAEERTRVKDIEEKAEDLMQEIIRVNYAAAGDLSAAISSGKLLSPRGSITIDSRMNTLIIKDTQKSIEKIKELVQIMDVAKPQVMIEAKLVTVSNDYREALGIRWGGSFASQTFPNTVGGNFSVNTPTETAGADVSRQGGGLDLTLGRANSVKVDLSISALETINKAKTLSNPKILTVDNEPATIQQGSTFFIETVSQNGTQTEERTATLSLTVTPKITPDGYVQLKVSATDNSLVSVTPPVVDTKSLNTQALVKNGETLVLGGIYTTSKSEGEEGVPLLSRVPGLGWLFKTKTQSGPNVKELLIFITPTIVSQAL